MYELTIHDSASDDLEEIIATDEDVGLKIFRLVEELQDDQDLLDRLSQRDYGGWPKHPQPRNAFFNTGMWGKAQGAQMNLWRLRFFDREISGYRLIYAFFPPQSYILLAIAKKAEVENLNDENFNYELCHPISKRIRKDYEKLAEDFW